GVASVWAGAQGQVLDVFDDVLRPVEVRPRRQSVVAATVAEHEPVSAGVLGSKPVRRSRPPLPDRGVFTRAIVARDRVLGSALRDGACRDRQRDQTGGHDEEGGNGATEVHGGAPPGRGVTTGWARFSPR